ncbi:MAG: HAMP domain-containing protein [Deltaproteobacteria bacterium]|nr:HAMP domain-containing protein [Deltaproteobacteria bacterium]
MRLRRKITFAFFGVSSLVSILLALFLYRFVERQLESDLRDRLRDLSHVGSHTIDLPSYRTLLGKLGELDAAAVTAAERSDEYKRIYDELRVIRSAEPELIRYAYVLTPTDDPNNPKFVVDADVLQLVAKAASGVPGETEDISHFNKTYDVSEVPVLKKALVECAPYMESEFVHDPVFNVNSVSSYAPIAGLDGVPLRDAKGRCLGVLGVDITDKNMRTALDAAGGLAIKISLAMIALALIVSIAMGTVLTRSILALTNTVKRFADKDFSARTRVFTKDEVGQLGENFNTMASTIQEHNENLEELVTQRTKELTAEKATSERLLLNVLPGPIADRLKTGENLIVDRFDAVSVLFADIVGFTAMSSRTTPEELVTMLNDLFSSFDRLAEKHGLEKIKTIGDAYMVVAGIPQPIANHASAMAHMALDMNAAIKAYADKTSSELLLRIGIASGSVVAGVIGEKKFIYDLWGDTVNTASRMESSGVPGRIHVTEATYMKLRDEFELEQRPQIEIKGKGLMTTYLIVGPKPRDPARESTNKLT